MNVRRVYITAALSVLLLAVANCGRDTVAPSDPASTSVIPDIVFFNGPTEEVIFEGRATDSQKMEAVYISFDNGTTWKTTTIDSDPPNTVRNVEWSYLASFGDMPAALSTLVIRAVDWESNETSSDPVLVARESGSTVASLQSAIAGASLGDVLFLSTGAGDAYGDSATFLTLSPTLPITIVGAGFGDALTSWGADPGGDTASTILESSSTSSPVFSVAADLTIKGLRILGGQEAVRVNLGVSGPAVVVEECVLDMQSAWGVLAADADSGMTVEVLSSLIDASTATNSSRGGLHVVGVSYLVSGSWFVGQSDPGGPEDGAVQGAAAEVVAGTGTITESLFDGNALAIWANGSSPLITSCNVLGANAATSYGINLSSGSGAATLRRNLIDEHSGYGVRIGGTMELNFRNNVVSNNGFSGVLIDSDLTGSDLFKIDLGTSDNGDNDLFGNTHPDVAVGKTQLYVTTNTAYSSLHSIPAEANYWGNPPAGEESVVYHGLDNGLDRAVVDFIPAESIKQN